MMIRVLFNNDENFNLESFQTKEIRIILNIITSNALKSIDKSYKEFEVSISSRV